jgi:hypothetical protein
MSVVHALPPRRPFASVAIHLAATP